MKVRKAILTSVVGLVCYAGLALANSDQTVGIRADTCVYSIGSQPQQTCQQVMYMAFQSSGRVSINIPTDIGTIGFSGGEDLQADSQHYGMIVDSLLIGSADMTSKRIPARGKCAMTLSKDGGTVYSIACEADTDFGKAVLLLQGRPGNVSVMSQPKQ